MIPINSFVNKNDEPLFKWLNKLLENEGIILQIVRSRKRKLGDYCYNPTKKNHTITINNDLSEELFTVTLLHEIAHKLSFDKYNRNIKPHGKEWKLEFCKLLNEAINYTSSNNTKSFLIKNIQKPKATFRITTQIPDGAITVKDLKPGDEFQINNFDKHFLLIKKLRKRYQCREKTTSKIYSVSADAIVVKSN